MVWTAPMTAVAGVGFTAAQYNLYIRDNLLETLVAKAATAGQYFVSTGAFAVAPRQMATATVSTSQTTTSTDFTDLATVGPSVTVETGQYAIIFLAARGECSSANFHWGVSFSVSGATDLTPPVTWKLSVDGTPAAQKTRASLARMETALVAGTNTFTMKYRVGSGTGTFADRQITVLPL